MLENEKKRILCRRTLIGFFQHHKLEIVLLFSLLTGYYVFLGEYLNR